MKKLIYTVSFRLFLTLIVVLIILLGAFIYFTLNSQEQHMMNCVHISANRLSDFIKGSTRYGMLLNRREDTHQIINRLGMESGIEVIRIYNKKGEIMYSSIEEEIGKSVDMSAEACYICHSEQKPIESIPEKNRSRVVTRPDGHRSLGLINPIKNEADCSNAACHAHPTDIKVLGVLDIKMSLDHLDRNIDEAKNQVLMFSVFLIIFINLVTAVFIHKLVHKPVRLLIEGAKAISSGNLNHKIALDSKTEIGELAKTFNLMTEKLNKAYNEIKEWSLNLEVKVNEKTEELKRVQSHLFHVEKMASLGQLAATVAHELNNPLEGILTLTKLQIKRLNKNSLTKEELDEILKDLNFIAEETLRSGNIVKNLLLFSRTQATDFKEANIEEVIEKCILLIQHHLKLKNINLVKDYQIKDKFLLCNSQQLQQAFLALMINSVEAMPNGGELKIAIYEVGEDSIDVLISDTGIGIPENIKDKIFEPFFSTKPEGKGIGLGLSVVYGIISNHNGKISLDSVVGKGTTFKITLYRKINKQRIV